VAKLETDSQVAIVIDIDRHGPPSRRTRLCFSLDDEPLLDQFRDYESHGRGAKARHGGDFGTRHRPPVSEQVEDEPSIKGSGSTRVAAHGDP